MSGATGAVFAVSSVLGPVLGGVICNQTTWRWIFLLNVPVGGAAIFLILLAWPNPVANQALSLHRSSLAQLDSIGLLLITAATVLLIVGLQEAGSAIITWGSSITIGLLTASGVSALGLIAWTWFLESRGDRTQVVPIFPSAFLKRRVLLGTIVYVDCFSLLITILRLFIPEANEAWIGSKMAFLQNNTLDRIPPLPSHSSATRTFPNRQWHLYHFKWRSPDADALCKRSWLHHC